MRLLMAHTFVKLISIKLPPFRYYFLLFSLNIASVRDFESKGIDITIFRSSCMFAAVAFDLSANPFRICILFHCTSFHIFGVPRKYPQWNFRPAYLPYRWTSGKHIPNLHPVSLYLTISGYTQRLSFVLVFEATLDQILYWPHHTLIFA